MAGRLRTALRNRSVEEAPIKAPAMNITLGSVGVLALGSVLTTWRQAFEFLFGKEATPDLRAAVLIATLAAIAVVVAVDMLSRALAVRTDERHVVPAGRDWSATVVRPGTDDDGFQVVALRGGADGVEYLLVKAGTAPAWYGERAVALHAPADA